MGLSVQTAGTENGTMEKQEHWKTLEQSRIKKAKQLAKTLGQSRIKKPID